MELFFKVQTMIKKIFLITVLILFIITNTVRGYNISSSLYSNTDQNHTRDGRFLFDSLFGLELEEELINAAAQNTLKSCDCGMLHLYINVTHMFGR